jgi:cell shape-determining protein MreC
MKTILLALTILLISVRGTSQKVDKLVSDYLAVKNAMVNDDSKTANEAIATFQETLKRSQNLAQNQELLKAGLELASAKTLDNQRAAFNELSTNLWKVVKSAEKKEPLYYQYCPMKKAYWLSKEKEIKNPYYGSAMLTCGKVVETN